MSSVLVVEDERIVALHLTQSLERMGYVVTDAVGTSDDAIQSAAKRCPDLVLMDIHIEGERDGIETAEILRARFGIPVVYLTAHADEPTRERAMETDPSGYLIKPFDDASLRGTIETALHRHAIETRLRQRERLLMRDAATQRDALDRANDDRLASLATLAAGVAHEINNPLTYLMLHAELATRGAAAIEQAGSADGKLVRESIDAVREAAQRIARIVGDLLAFSQPSPAALRGIDPGQSVEWALRTLGPAARERARLTTKLGKLPHVMADPARVVAVVQHVIQNAIDAIPEGVVDAHEIEVATSTQGSDVVITVRDTGHGIADDVRPRVFDPFFTTKPAGRGSGMGLSAAHGIVTSLGGRIDIESAVGRGTTVRVVLPATFEQVEEGDATDEPDAAALVTSVAPQPALAAADLSRAMFRGRILVVDDEPMICRLLVRMLEDEHSVTEAHGGAEATRRLEVLGSFDLVLCDLLMPPVHGMDVYERCLARDPSQAARFVFMTGGAYTARAAEFLEAVQSPRLQKPIRGAELRRFVRGYMRQHGRLGSATG